MKTCKKHRRTFSYGHCPRCEDDARTAHSASDSSAPFVMPTYDYGSSSSSYDSPASDSSSSSDFGGGGGFDGGGGGSDF